ncbi:uncharacterized protein LOC141822335 [Curcuma longa]|uniref:uncharacterized protein LOC141822335 n=1 Tax=Curcuma longa TaxID=136217 RepID=UPI003D9E6026
MGCVGCCLREHNVEEQEHQNRRRLDSFVKLVADLYHSLFHRRERVVPSDEQGTVPLVLTSLVNHGENNAADLLLHDNPRSSQPQAQQDSLGLGHTKDNTACPLSSNDPIGSQSQRQNEDLVLGHAVIPGGVQKSVSIRHETGTNTQPDWSYKNGSADGEGSNACHSGSSQPSAGTTDRVPYLYLSSDIEDLCPICLEDYTIENPRSTLQCAHQFHLCCIYEWMERSHACPFCSRLMLFKEDP